MNHQAESKAAKAATAELRKIVPGSKRKPQLTRKQAAFVRELIEHPKQSATAAAYKAYSVNNEATAASVASENLRKPEIMAWLHDHAAEAEMALTKVLDSSSERAADSRHAAVVVSAANSILDRVHGKPTQKVESTSVALTIGIDLANESWSDDVIEGEQP